MGFLFKTTLIHVKKNLSIVSVLGFFVASGISVLSSVDLLSANLNKGFQEVNYDSNPHDLVLLSKLFKPSQELKIYPSYSEKLETLELTPNWGYKWSFDSNKENSWIKAEDKGDEGITSTDPDKVFKLSPSIFSIPFRHDLHKYVNSNVYLECVSAASFVTSLSKEFRFADRNASTFFPVDRGTKKIEIFDSKLPYSSARFNEYCFDGASSTKPLRNFSHFLYSVYAYYQLAITGGSFSDESKLSDNEMNNSKNQNKRKLTHEEISEIYRKLGAFNPKRFWREKITSNKDSYRFRPLWESDFYFTFEMPFQNMLAGNDISKKFRDLLENMKQQEIFYRLDDETKQNIILFLNNKSFEKLSLNYYLTSFSELLNEFSNWLPMIPGLTYKETSILLLKLILWDSVKDSTIITNLVDSLKWSEKIKKKLEEIIDSWDTRTIKGIEDWNIFEQFGEANGSEQKQQDKKPEKSEKYLFSTLRADKKLSELKSQALEEYKKYESSESENVDKDFCSGSSGDCSNLTYQESDKLIEAVKKTLISWIKEEFKKPNDKSKKKFIPAFNKNSYQKLTANSGAKPFSKNSGSYDYYRTFPDDFEDVYKTLVEQVVIKGLKTHLISVEIENLKAVKKFISDHEIFTLSFLLNNFSFDPTQINKKRNAIKDLNDRKAKFPPQGSTLTPNKASSSYKNLYSEDYTPSVNYHKSLVITNSSTVSSKLNDKVDEQTKLPEKWGHSFKVITQERKDDSYVNRIKIISGNPLFEAPNDNIVDLRKIVELESYDDKDYNVILKALPAFKLLSRAKFTNPAHKELIQKYYKFFNDANDETWKSKNWISFDDRSYFLRLHSSIIENAKNILTQGSKLFFRLDNFQIIHFLRTFKIISEVSPIPSPAYIDQFSSYFAIVSPDYAQKNNIKPISNEQYEKFKKIVEGGDTTQEEWENAYSFFVVNPANHDSIINVNGNKLIVVGTGMSPDMFLPSQSLLNIIPNKEKEALVFVDKYGYKNIKYNSLSSWDEYYLSISYPQVIKDLGKEAEYKDQLEDFMTQFLLGKNAEDVEVNTEFSLLTVKNTNSLNLVFLRSNYVDYFLGTTNAISWTLLIFMGSIIFFTVWVLVKKYVASSLNTFGIFVANGIPRSQIILNSFSFILIPAVIGSLFGYFISLALQPTIFSMVSDIWYLSPVFSGFNLSSMLYYLTITLGTLAPLSWISAYLMMKEDVSQLMKVNVVFKHNKVTEAIYKLFRNASPLWKFRASVIMNTINRGLILSSATVFLFVFSSFLFNNLGQFKSVSDFEIATKDYGFDMFLETPSEQSGQPHLSSYVNLGDSFMNYMEHEKQVPVQKSAGKWEVETVKFGKNNPELVASGLYSPYIPKDLEHFYNTCSNKLGLNDWYKKLGTFDFDYPAHVFNNTPYNSYIFGNLLTRKTAKAGESSEIDCSKGLHELYERKALNLPFPEVDAVKVFYSSRHKTIDDRKKNSDDERKFKVDISYENAKALAYLGDYVPVKNELRKKTTTSRPNKQLQDKSEEYEMIKFGSEPLFKPLIDHYKGKDKALNIENVKKSEKGEYTSYSFWQGEEINNSTKYGTATLEGEDFLKFDTHYHPTLRRLFKDQANYWLFSYQDLNSVANNPVFFRNKVIMPILFNHDWTFQLFGKAIKINPWHEFSEFFSKYSTELMAAMNENYVNYIDAIIKSRYGAFFVNRFMTKHSGADNSAPHQPGKVFWEKPTWKVNKDIVKTENSGQIDEGLYWFDPDKIIYFYDKFKAIDQLGDALESKIVDSNAYKHPDRFVVLRPDFLYLFFALSKDPDFLKPEIAPMKISFHQNVYTPDYSKPFDGWRIEGDVAKDTAKKLGLTSEDTSAKEIDYELTPNGDQTYTYLDILLPGNNKLSKVIGLKKDPRGSFVKLRKDNVIINQKLYRSKFEDGSYPIIINHFTAKRLGAYVGSLIESDVFNTVDRYTKIMKKDLSKKKVKFRVVDIFDSYYSDAFYISQKNANEIIGLNLDYGYNGIRTKRMENKQDLPMQLIKAVSGYSAAGIYAKQKISKSSNTFLSFLNSKAGLILDGNWTNHYLNQPVNYEWIKLKSGLSGIDFSRPDQIASALEEAYGNDYSIISSIIGIENASLFNDFVFRTVSDLVLSTINLFISVFAPLLVCALLIITTLIIEDLKNLLTILNLLGFTYVENSITILLYLGLILGFSLFLAIPISSVLLSVYVDGLFKTLSIYLPIYLRFDYALLSFVLLLGVFGFSYWTSMRKIKGTYLPVAMKSLNE